MNDFTALFEALEEHGNLSKACRDLKVTRSHFLNQCDLNPELEDKYARAKQRGLTKMMEELLDEKVTDAAISRLEWDRKRWHASKLFPKQFGDKQTHEHTGGITVTSGAHDADI